MAAQANTMSLVTNLNVDPYYDDFDESKNFHIIEVKMSDFQFGVY